MNEPEFENRPSCSKAWSDHSVIPKRQGLCGQWSSQAGRSERPGTTARGSAAAQSDQGQSWTVPEQHGSPWAHQRGRALSPSLETWLQSPRPQPSRLPAPGEWGGPGAVSGAPEGPGRAVQGRP